MKVSKDARRIARQLLKATVKDGKVDSGVVKTITKKLSSEKPRGFLGVLVSYARLVRLELESNHAVIESAVDLSSEARDSVAADLKKKYGDQLTTEYQTNAKLIGGMRVKVGSDVWDGSVRNRLDRLRDNF